MEEDPTLSYPDRRFAPDRGHLAANDVLDTQLAGLDKPDEGEVKGADEVEEAVFLEALERGHAAMQDTIRMQHEMHAACGKEKRAYQAKVEPEGIGLGRGDGVQADAEEPPPHPAVFDDVVHHLFGDGDLGLALYLAPHGAGAVQHQHHAGRYRTDRNR